MPAEFEADCARCVGLCCVAPAFARSADFAIDKPAGEPCGNLLPDLRCGIHADLREQGFRGCAVFDCFGAGQQVTQVTFAGSDWRTPAVAPAMFAAFGVMRQVQELRSHLAEALALVPDADPERLAERAAALAAAGPADLAAFDVAALRREAGDLLLRVSERVRPRGPDHRNADLVGASLRGASLRGAMLRGAYLIGADLRGADLRQADVLGADLRAAELGGADLRGALFLTRPQLSAANGDARTRLPAGVDPPPHWPRL